MHLRVLLGLFMIGLLLLVGAVPQLAEQGIQKTSAQSRQSVPVSIPFELVNRHIMLKVNVNNSRPLSFVLDTGDQFAIINLDVARELNLKLEGQVNVGGAGSELSTGAFVKNASFSFPGFAGFSQPVTLALPIGNLAPRMGRDFDGIIGSEFIKQFVLEVDYRSQVIKLHDKDEFTYSGKGESIPIELRSGHPIIDASLTPIGSDPIAGKFVLDIGSGGALALYSPFVAARRLLTSEMKTIKALGAGAGGEISGRVGRVSELKIGKFTISNPITMFSQDKKGAFASASLQGNIGAQIASKFRLFLDYSHNRIIFEPNSTFAEPFDRTHSGLMVQAYGKDYRTFRITNVLENSPASEAGLLQNDIITAIDGTPSEGLTLTRLNEMFERPVTYKLTVRRGEKTMNVKLTPRKLV